MANDINQVTATGRLGADPETRYFQDGTGLTTARIAVGSQWKDKATGERKEHTEWMSVVFRGPVAEIAAQYLKKGSRVLIQGRLRTRKWQASDGTDRYSTEVVVGGPGDILQMLDKREGGAGDGKPDQRSARHGTDQRAAQPAQPPADFDDDIPF